MALPDSERPDVIVAEDHEGANDGTGSTLEEQVDQSAVFRKIVTETSPLVDVIFTGHTHKEYAWDGLVPGADKTRPIVQTGSYGQNVGRVILQVDRVSGEVESYVAENVSTTPQPAVPVADLRSFSAATEAAYGIVLAAEQKADEEGFTVTGRISATISRAYTGGDYVDGAFQTNDDSREDRASASPLGILVANMLRDQLSVLQTIPDLGVVGPGDRRTDLTHDQGLGNITVAQAMSVLPFQNELTVVPMTGDQLYTLLEQQWQRAWDGQVPSRSFLYLGLSYNVRYTYHEAPDPDISGATKGIVDAVLVDGKPVDRSATYRVAARASRQQAGTTSMSSPKPRRLTLVCWISRSGLRAFPAKAMKKAYSRTSARQG